LVWDTGWWEPPLPPWFFGCIGWFGCGKWPKPSFLVSGLPGFGFGLLSLVMHWINLRYTLAWYKIFTT
jgi:hypothetical protein